MRWRELRFRAGVAVRRRVPGGRLAQRTLVREDFRDLRRLEPVSNAFGFDRGQPIDRWYIDRFLEQHVSRVTGRVLEVGDSRYTDAYGSGTSKIDVLSREEGRGVTLVGDLETGEGVPTTAYDCVVATQVLNFVYDVSSAVRALHDALVPGGSALITVAGISPISAYDETRSGDYWRFTEASFRRLLQDAFGAGTVEVVAYGNVLSAAALLYGLAAEDLSDVELTSRDARFPMLIAARADRA